MLCVLHPPPSSFSCSLTLSLYRLSITSNLKSQYHESMFMPNRADTNILSAGSHLHRKEKALNFLYYLSIMLTATIEVNFTYKENDLPSHPPVVWCVSQIFFYIMLHTGTRRHLAIGWWSTYKKNGFNPHINWSLKGFYCLSCNYSIVIFFCMRLTVNSASWCISLVINNHYL